MAELTLEQLEDELAKSTIVAPVDGEIVFMGGYKIGEFVPGRSIVLTVADPNQIQFEYSGSQIARIRHGMEVDITVGTKNIPARVSMTPVNAPAEDRDRFRNTVIFSVNDPDDLPNNLKRGSRHKFRIFIEEKHDTIILPAGILSNFMGQNFVQVLEDGMRIERDVMTGIVTSTQVEILTGLNEGDLVIVGIER